MTAGHCVQQAKDLTQYYWVFDYKLDPSTQSITLNVGPESVFEAREVLSTTGTTRADATKNDYALIKLARSATRTRDGRPSGRTPLKVRRSGKIEDDAKLIMIGHPLGLPQKVTIAGKIRRNHAKTHFKSTLDAFGGNSGSPVIHAKTGVVEGILVRGTARNWKEVVIGTKSFATPIHFEEETGGFGTDVERITNVPQLRQGLGVGNQLFDAIAAKDLEAVRRLLGRTPDLKRAKDARGRNLMHAIMAARSLELLAELKDKGISLTARDKFGKTPLHSAAEHQFLAGARFLLRKRVPVNVTDRMGRTPHWIASKQGKTAVSRLLVRAGANTAIKPRNYQKLSEQLAAAAQRGDFERVVELCGTPGVDVNLGPFTPLMRAVQRGHEGMVAFLLQHPQIDVNATTFAIEDGINALYLARRRSSKRIVKRLIAAGAKDPKASKLWGSGAEEALRWIQRQTLTWGSGSSQFRPPARQGSLHRKGSGLFAVQDNHYFLNKSGYKRFEKRSGTFDLKDIASVEKPKKGRRGWIVHLDLKRSLLHVETKNGRGYMSSTCKVVLPSQAAANRWRSNLLKARHLRMTRARLAPTASNRHMFGLVLSHEEIAAFGDKWTKQARAGNATALTQVGVAYIKGERVRKNIARGSRALVRAYELSNDRERYQTAFNLGILYRDGAGLPRDVTKARTYFREALKAGNHNARKALDQLSSPGK